jgi:hypothetical protein
MTAEQEKLRVEGLGLRPLQAVPEAAVGFPGITYTSQSTVKQKDVDTQEMGDDVQRLL